MEQDCSPAKLFLCQMIYCSYGFCGDGRSDLCQQLVLSMNQEEASLLKRLEAQYILKLKGGWEPSYSECLSFFSGFPVCKQAAEEWRQQILDTHTLILWFSKVDNWKSSYDEENELEEDRELLFFVSTILAAFYRFSLIQCNSVFNNLLTYFSEYPKPSNGFPPYSVHFTPEQRDSWIQQVQEFMYQHLGEFDINSLQNYIHSIVPIPLFLDASFLILKQDYSQAISLLSQSAPPASTLFTLTHYLISCGQTEGATRLIQQLAILIHLSKRRELDSWLSILYFECSLNPQFLFSASFSSSSRSYAVFTLLKTSIAQPQVLDMLPSTLQSDIYSVLGHQSIVDLQDALDWATSSSDFGGCLSSFIESHEEIAHLLSSEDRLFVELSQSDAFQRVEDLKQKFCHYKIAILVNRSYLKQIISHIRTNQIKEALGCLKLWRIELESLPMTTLDHWIESVLGNIMESICWFRLANKIRGYECLLSARQMCQKHHLVFYDGLCELIFVLMSIESGDSLPDGEKRLLEHLPLFVKLRQKQIVLWTLAAVSFVQSRRDILYQLLFSSDGLSVEKEDLVPWLRKFSHLIF